MKHAWGSYYFSYSIATAFDNLYTNKFGMQDHFSTYWKTLVETFKNEEKILGYEILNEPFAGNFFKNPALMLPSVAEYLNV